MNLISPNVHGIFSVYGIYRPIRSLDLTSFRFAAPDWLIVAVNIRNVPKKGPKAVSVGKKSYGIQKLIFLLNLNIDLGKYATPIASLPPSAAASL